MALRWYLGRPPADGWTRLGRPVKKEKKKKKFNALSDDGRVLCYGGWTKEGKKYMGSWPTLPPPLFFHFFSHTLLNIILVSYNHKSTISTCFIFYAAVVWGCQVVETKIYFRFRRSTRPPSCRGKIRAAFRVSLKAKL
jgi:hypothetical protein